MAANFKDMEKRVKKLETQVKSKVNETDLEVLRVEMHSELEENATTKALHELEQSKPTEETTRQMIKEDFQSKGTTPVTATTTGSTEEEDRDRHGEIANEIMDIERRKNIIIYRVDKDPQSSYLTQEEQRNAMDTKKVKKIIKAITGSEGEEKTQMHPSGESNT